MTDLAITQPAALTDAEYEAIADQLLRDMDALSEKMKVSREHRSRLRDETQRSWAECVRMREENRALIARLQAAF